MYDLSNLLHYQSSKPKDLTETGYSCCAIRLELQKSWHLIQAVVLR
jgi:hypothetical protein